MKREEVIALRSREEERTLLGPRDVHLRAVRERFGVEIICRHQRLRVRGEEGAVAQAVQALSGLLARLRRGEDLTAETVTALLRGDSPGAGPRPRTAGQARYWELMDRNPVVFAEGPAGTGKTFLAVAKAVSMLRAGQVRRIVLARPAVEAGEKLGFLPGDLQAKVNPYLRPLYDALNDCLGFEQTQRYLERDIIEIVPLAYMRGRTLKSSFIILDEAQNTTPKQMLMFLTRMAEDSHTVVTGDTTQIDLPSPEESGLVDALRRLQGIPGIGVARLGKQDIVRHPLVQKILEAYGKEGAL